MLDQSDQVTAIILAGGRGQRVEGEDKGLLTVAGQPLIEYTLARVKQQTSRIIISANRNIDQYAAYGFPVIADSISGFQGPLAGIEATLNLVETPYAFFVPCDVPLLPLDTISSLLTALTQSNGDIAIAHDGQQTQQLVCLMKTALLPSLTAYLKQGNRKAMRWMTMHHPVEVKFSAGENAFLNINSKEDITSLERYLARR